MMASCEHMRDVGAYHDGERPEEDARRLEEHIRQCPVCMRELEQLGSLRRFLTAAMMPAAPPAVIERMHRVVRTSQERVIIRMAGTITAIAAAVLLACSLWLWRAGEATQPASDAGADWEQVALAGSLGDSAAADGQTIEQWILSGLSAENGQ